MSGRKSRVRTSASRSVGARTHPPGRLTRMTARLGGTTGLFGIGGVIRDMAATTDMLCDDVPAVLHEIHAGAIVADQTEPAGGLVARHLGIPLVSVANALLIDREPSVPPPFIGWGYDASPWGVQRNLGGYRIAGLADEARLRSDRSAGTGLASRRHRDESKTVYPRCCRLANRSKRLTFHATKHRPLWCIAARSVGRSDASGRRPTTDRMSSARSAPCRAVACDLQDRGGGLPRAWTGAHGRPWR